MNVRFLDPAIAEFDDAVAYYQNQREGLGTDLAREVEAGIKRIKLHPKAWRLLDGRVR